MSGLILQSVWCLPLTEDGHHHPVWPHVPRLTGVVPAVAHGHVVDGQRGAALLLQSQLVVSSAASRDHLEISRSGK